MGVTSIEWTDFSFNPVWGCEQISPACDNCYAKAWARRLGMPELWEGRYRLFGDAHWREPLKWDRQAARDGVRRKVFCASQADVFDKGWPVGIRERLWALIEATPNLDWLLLTKRIGNAARMLPAQWLEQPRQNVWLGATFANQEELQRDVMKLLEIPACVHFCSFEPLLGPVDLTSLTLSFEKGTIYNFNCLRSDYGRGVETHDTLDWLIVGGESGARARPFVLGWGKDIVRQCREAGVACFVKQVGARPVNREGERCPHILDRKGKVMEEWPEELRVREFPRTGSSLNNQPKGDL